MSSDAPKVEVGAEIEEFDTEVAKLALWSDIYKLITS
jgi:hypothetical protein